MNENKEKKLNNKGFSLVELIIVIAIMGILVGVVGTQVVPYMEKGREAKDQQILSSVATAVTSAIALVGEDVEDLPNVKLSTLDTMDSKKYENLAKQVAALLLPEGDTARTIDEVQTTLAKKFTSKKAKNTDFVAPGTIYISYFRNEGKLYVYLVNAATDTPDGIVRKGIGNTDEEKNSITINDDVALYVESN